VPAKKSSRDPLAIVEESGTSLSDEHNEKQRLEEALQLNSSLATAYYLKEDLRQLWQRTGQICCQSVSGRLDRRARASDVAMLHKFAQTLDSHREGILAYFDFPISTGPLEGTNNKIKTLQKQAYGFRDMDFFKLKIYALHETRYALIG
jgi:transposase